MIRHVLHFADCRLDIAARELRRANRRVDLPPTVFDCIAYLVEHRDRAVGRDERVAAVWGRTTVGDTMLGKAILAARRDPWRCSDQRGAYFVREYGTAADIGAYEQQPTPDIIFQNGFDD